MAEFIPDLSAFTTAQLTTMRDNLSTAMSGGLTNKRYKIGNRELERFTPTELLKLASAVSAELNARTDTTGGVGLAVFYEQE